MPRIAVLISGNGTNLQAIIDAISNKILNAKIGLVLSNRSKARGLERARKAGIPTEFIGMKTYISQRPVLTRDDYMKEVARRIKSYFAGVSPDLVVLAGWMLIVTKEFIEEFSGSIINIHPALPREFDGNNAIANAFKAFQRKEIKRTGVMVHWVIPEIDAGAVIRSREVPILESDTLETLEARIHEAEHVLIVDAIRTIFEDAADAPPQSDISL